MYITTVEVESTITATTHEHAPTPHQFKSALYRRNVLWTQSKSIAKNVKTNNT